jgi:UDP-N-acetylglucosamine 2-epimerase
VDIGESTEEGFPWQNRKRSKPYTVEGSDAILYYEHTKVLAESNDNRRHDALLILRDTNSALSAVSAKLLKILIFHMEAGNRYFDENLPEERAVSIVVKERLFTKWILKNV